MTCYRPAYSKILPLVLALPLIAASSPATAHTMSGGRMHLRIAGRTAYLTATPAAAAFSRFDRDKDGRLSRAEVRAARPAMLAHFVASLRLLDQRGVAASAYFSDLNVLHAHGHRSGLYVRVTLRLRWSRAPVGVTVRYGEAARAPLWLTAQRATTSMNVTSQPPLGQRSRTRLAGQRAEVTLFGPAPALRQLPSQGVCR